MWQFITRWHRRFGIISALFVIMLVITGLMLNHTDRLSLDSRYMQNDFLLDLYNIHPAEEPLGFRVNNYWISKVGERIYFANKEIADDIENLTGAVSVGDEIIVAFDNELLILSNAGEMIERLGGSEGVPSGMRGIGITDSDELVIKGSHGDYLVDLHNLDWHEEKYIHANWSVAEILPGELQADLMQLYRGKGLPVERVVLDMHSGRLFGAWGIYIVDVAALLFFLLAVTGIWMWCKKP